MSMRLLPMRSPRRLMLWPMLLSTAWVSHGCDQIGVVGGFLAAAVPKRVAAAYKGLANQTCVVCVWVDQGPRMDYPDLQLDLASGLQNKLIEVQAADHPDELTKTTFPVNTTMIVDDQEKHPELEQLPATEVAKRYIGTRLIYVTVTDFTVHANMSPELFRGKMTADVKVIQITPDPARPDDPKAAIAKQVYNDADITVMFPKDDPTDGLPIGTESTTTQGTVKAMVDKLAKKFYTHDEDRD
jgi:hypothetical protein